jgi:predicted nucleotidyltransferase
MDIIEQLRILLSDLLTGTAVQLAYLHGSVAQGRALPGSDVDIALVGGAKVTSRERLAISLHLERELAQAGVRNADVRFVDTAPLLVRGRVVTQGVRLYAASPEARVDFEVPVLSAYFDFVPAARRLESAYLEYVKEHGLYG